MPSPFSFVFPSSGLQRRRRVIIDVIQSKTPLPLWLCVCTWREVYSSVNIYLALGNFPSCMYICVCLVLLFDFTTNLKGTFSSSFFLASTKFLLPCMRRNFQFHRSSLSILLFSFSLVLVSSNIFFIVFFPFSIIISFYLLLQCLLLWFSIFLQLPRRIAELINLSLFCIVR